MTEPSNTAPCCLGLGQTTSHPGMVTVVILNLAEFKHFSLLQSNLLLQVEVTSLPKTFFSSKCWVGNYFVLFS